MNDPGKPDAGKPPVRFDEGRAAAAENRHTCLPTLLPSIGFIIQVKSQRANGVATQVAETPLDTAKRVIGFAPENYSVHAWQGAAEPGIPFARNFDELVQILEVH
jgi:hypothetical protein